MSIGIYKITSPSGKIYIGSSLNINKSYEGKVVEVMVEGPSKSDKTRFTGRTRTNKIVIWDKQGDEATGDLINVKITKAQTWVLNGELI